MDWMLEQDLDWLRAEAHLAVERARDALAELNTALSAAEAAVEDPTPLARKVGPMCKDMSLLGEEMAAAHFFAKKGRLPPWREVQRRVRLGLTAVAPKSKQQLLCPHPRPSDAEPRQLRPRPHK